MVSSFVRWVILTRDNFTCQDCHKKGLNGFWRNYDLDAHHIDGKRENHTYNNQITLCDECHLKAHGYNWQSSPIKSFSPKTINNEIIRQARQTFSLDKTPIDYSATETIESEKD